MGRSSLVVRLARWLQSMPLWLFQWLEWPFLRRRSTPKALFVLALPRSGSTLTYQAISHGLSVQYLCNLGNLLYQLPWLGGRLSRSRVLNHESDFTSRHGFVSGLDGPAEGLRFWSWWLDCGLSDEDCAVLPESRRVRRIRYLRRALGGLTHRKPPFASAYLGHTLVPDRLYTAFPEAVLVRVRREPVANALSLLKAMRADSRQWFSVVPRECQVWEHATEHERVAAQVYWLNRRLDDADAAAIYLDVSYERLCESPQAEIARIRERCLQQGVDVDLKWPLPEQFPYKKADVEADEDARRIHQALGKLEQEHGGLKQQS